MISDQQYFAPYHDPDSVRIIPLGGCGEFGMNLTAFLVRGKLFVIDAGVRFPEPFRLGIDAMLPNVDPWFQAAGGVHAYLLTHGHEDHLGAMPHLLQKWPAPVYGTGWTIELLRSKFSRMGKDPNAYKLNVVEAGDHVVTAGFDAEFVHVNHSIPMTCSLFLRLPGLTIFHTGDFKFEQHPILEKPTDFEKLAAIGNEGVDLLLTDSTNADKDGFCPGEDTVFEPLKDVVNACEKAAIITTFSSNLGRLKTIVDVCQATGRKLYITGGGLEGTLAIAKNLGLYHLPENLRVADDQLGSIPRERLLVLTTGCQGERRSGLARIASGEHRHFRISDGDTVIWSSRLIPGNERAVISLSNNLLRAGARVITAREAPGIHVSGHAYGGDIDHLVGLLKPRHYLPVHGAFSQLHANSQRPERLGISTQCQLIESGDVLDASRFGVDVVGHIDVELAFVDGDSSTILSYEDLRERLRIGELGAALVDGVFDFKRETWLVRPSIEFTGLAFPISINEAKWRADKAAKVANIAAQGLLQKGQNSEVINEEIRKFIRRELQLVLKKKPVVTVRLHVV